MTHAEYTLHKLITWAVILTLLGAGIWVLSYLKVVDLEKLYESYLEALDLVL